MEPELAFELTYEAFYKYLFAEILEKEYTELPEYGGAGRKYATPKHMAEKAIEYLLRAHRTNERIHFQGMRLYLKLFTPQEFNQYRNVKEHNEDFKKVTYIIRSLMEKVTVDMLFDQGTYNAAKFALQCGYGDWIPAEKVINENHDIKVTIGKKKDDEDDEDEQAEI